MMLLSLLIPTTQSRMEMTMSLVDSILDQVEQGNYIGLVEIIPLWDNGEKTIGTKRNELIQMATGKYIAFVDSDDELATNYIELLMDGIAQDTDCCSLRGIYTQDGGKEYLFEHSIKYPVWETVDATIKYLRPPNHLNCIKKEIANQFKFPEIMHGEDRVWSDAIKASGLIKTEHYIDSVLYHYKFLTSK